jgi:Ca2+-binding RTX toxin-like protein
MKKLLSIAILLLVACAPVSAHAKEPPLTLLLTAGPGDDVFDIKLSRDGRSYLIDSVSPLEAGGGVCGHAGGSMHALTCDAASIGGFEVNAGPGDDSVIVSPRILVPATLRGGPGDDRLRGGGAADKILGGPGSDALLGEAGDDWLFGEAGDDWLLGGAGNDRLTGGTGADWLYGGRGADEEELGPRDQSGPTPPPGSGAGPSGPPSSP